MTTKKRILMFILTTATVLLYQNCAPYESANFLGDQSSSSLALSTEQKANAIIRVHCTACHGSNAIPNLNANGGIVNIENMNLMISTGVIVPGQPNSSRLVMAPEEGAMPPSYKLSFSDTAILREWVLAMGAPPPVTKPTCTVSVDKTSIQLGQNVIATLAVQGTATAATLNNMQIPVTGGSLTIPLAATGTISGQVSSAAGVSNCVSPIVTVVAPPPATNVTCTLAASQPGGVVPGDSINLTMTIKGAATIATINGRTVPVANPVLVVNPIADTNYVATVADAAGTSTCAVQVTTKSAASLTKDEFFRAKIGPSGQSIDDLAIRCSACHTQNPPAAYALAPSAFIFIPGDYAGNIAKFKRVVNPKNPAQILNLTSLPLNQSLYQFASGHKPKNPPFTSAELNHITNYVNKP